MLVCIEGPDGCGKSEVAAAVGRALGGCDVISFPNDAAFTGPAIRAYLRREWGVDLNPEWPVDTDAGRMGEQFLGALAFQALQVTNRMEMMPSIFEAQQDGRHLVLCRYWQSAWVYGQLDGLPGDFLERIHASMVQPDLNVLLDAKPETCMARRERRDGIGRNPERYEGRLDRTRKIVELYRACWLRAGGPRSGTGKWVAVDAEQPLDEVIRVVLRQIDPRLGAAEVSDGEG